MQRRSFLAAMGIMAAESVLIPEIWPLQTLPSYGFGPAAAVDAIGFKKYHGRSAFELFLSRKFRTYLEVQFPGMRSPFCAKLSLWSGIWNRLVYGDVTVENNRFLLIKGFVRHAASDRAMMWVDTTKPKDGVRPLVVLSFLDHKKDVQQSILRIVPSLPISSRAYEELPHHFTMTMNRWLRSRRPISQDRGLISKVVFHEPSSESWASPLENFGIKKYRTAQEVAIEKGFPVAQ